MKRARKSGDMIYEDGKEFGTYTVIPNDVLEKIAEIDLTKGEMKVLLRIIRNTIGYEVTKKMDGTSVRRLSYDFTEDYLEEKTGVSKEKVATILDNLEKRRIIKRQGITVTFNNNLGEWYSSNEKAEEAEKESEIRKSFKEKEQREQEEARWKRFYAPDS